MMIGLCGFARSGKDTAAIGMAGYVRKAFADALKVEAAAYCMSVYRINPMRCTPEEKEAIRWFLVGHGRARRLQHPDYWIEAMESSLPHALPRSMIVVTDVRYANECEWIERNGGRVVMIIRPGVVAARDEERESIGQIVSRGLVSATVDNNGTPEELAAKVMAIAAA
jgi:hypothetical protein